MHNFQVALLDRAVEAASIQFESEGRKAVNNGAKSATTTMAEWRWRRV
jgi:hypothetical protein